MPEREYTGKSLSRVEAMNQTLLKDHRRIENNKQIIDNYILEDPSRIDQPNVVSKSDIVRSQDASNLEEAKSFSNEHFHELVDIAMADAARAGKDIIDIRDVKDPEPAEALPPTMRYDVPHVRGMEDIVEARLAVVQQYCAENGIDQHDLTFEEALKIRSLTEWKNPLS